MYGRPLIAKTRQVLQQNINYFLAKQRLCSEKFFWNRKIASVHLPSGASFPLLTALYINPKKKSSVGGLCSSPASVVSFYLSRSYTFAKMRNLWKKPLTRLHTRKIIIRHRTFIWCTLILCLERVGLQDIYQRSLIFCAWICRYCAVFQ